MTGHPSPMMKDALTKEYRIAPDLRRCCWYFIAAAPVALVIAAWLSLSGVLGELERPGRPRPLASIALVALVTVPTIICLHWRLRVDEKGVWRRRLFRWRLWSWEEFSNGRIIKCPDHVLEDPQRAWWCRKMRLGWMEGGDIEEVLESINEHYQLPPPPEVPVTVTIKYGFRRRAILDDDGIQVTVQGETNRYRWSEVEKVHIRRFDPQRRDFTRLVVSFAGRASELKIGVREDGFTSFSATLEEVNQFLLQKIPTDRIVVLVNDDPCTIREDAEIQFEAVQKSKREMRIVAPVFATFALICVVMRWGENEFPRDVILGSSLVALFGVSFWIIRRDTNKRLAEAQEKLDSLGDNEQAASQES